MPTRIRFATARSVFDTFSDLSHVAPPPRAAAEPLDYARALIGSPNPNDAIIFIAHLLPRREAVWWGLECVRGLLGAGAEDQALRAAEAWVRAPEEGTRRAALAAYGAGHQRAPTTWLAFAAGWSGGSVTPSDKDPLPAPPAACPMGVNTAVMLAACAGDPLGVIDRVKACAEAGVRFANGGDARVTAPTGRRS
jgi:hypothetical protein